MTYLASPYSHPAAEVRQMRFELVRDYTLRCFAAGLSVFSPIVYSHQFALENGMRVGFHFWHKFDLEMIKGCSELWVLTLPGWKISEGVAAEVAYAESRDIPVKYVDVKEEVPA